MLGFEEKNTQKVGHQFKRQQSYLYTSSLTNIYKLKHCLDLKARLAADVKAGKKSKSGHFVDLGEHGKGVPIPAAAKIKNFPSDDKELKCVVKYNKTDKNKPIVVANLESKNPAKNTGHFSILEAVASAHFAKLAEACGLKANPSHLLIGEKENSPVGVVVEYIPGFCDFNTINLIHILAEIEYEKRNLTGPGDQFTLNRNFRGTPVKRVAIKAFLSGDDQAKKRRTLYKHYIMLLYLRQRLRDDDVHKANMAMQITWVDEKNPMLGIKNIDVLALDFDRMYSEVLAKFEGGVPLSQLGDAEKALQITSDDEENFPFMGDAHPRFGPDRVQNSLEGLAPTNNPARYFKPDVDALSYLDSLEDFRRAGKAGQSKVVRAILRCNANDLYNSTANLTPAALEEQGIKLLNEKQKRNYPEIYRNAFSDMQHELGKCYDNSVHANIVVQLRELGGNAETRRNHSFLNFIVSCKNFNEFEAKVYQPIFRESLRYIFDDETKDKVNRKTLKNQNFYLQIREAARSALPAYRLAEKTKKINSNPVTYGFESFDEVLKNIKDDKTLYIILVKAMDFIHRSSSPFYHGDDDVRKNRGIAVFQAIVSRITTAKGVSSILNYLEVIANKKKFVTKVQHSIRLQNMLAGYAYRPYETSTYQSLRHIVLKHAVELQERQPNEKYADAINHAYHMDSFWASPVKSLDHDLDLVLRLKLRINKLFFGKHQLVPHFWKKWWESKKGFEKLFIPAAFFKDFFIRLPLEGIPLFVSEVARQGWLYCYKLVKELVKDTKNVWTDITRYIRKKTNSRILSLLAGVLVVSIPAFCTVIAVACAAGAYAVRFAMNVVSKIIRRVTSPLAAAQDAHDYFQKHLGCGFLGFALSALVTMVAVGVLVFFAFPIVLPVFALKSLVVVSGWLSSSLMLAKVLIAEAVSFVFAALGIISQLVLEGNRPKLNYTTKPFVPFDDVFNIKPSLQSSLSSSAVVAKKLAAVTGPTFKVDQLPADSGITSSLFAQEKLTTVVEKSVEAVTHSPFMLKQK